MNESPSTTAQGRQQLPEALATVVDGLQVGVQIKHTLGLIESAAWGESVARLEWRADALTLAAYIYGELSDDQHDELREHIRARAAARCEVLSDLVEVAE